MSFVTKKWFLVTIIVLLVCAVTVAVVLPLTLSSAHHKLALNKQEVRLSNSLKPIPKKWTVACLMCVKDCAKYLPLIFENLNRLSKHFLSFHCIFVYDNCSDNSAELLNKYARLTPNVIVYHNVENHVNSIRTITIAHARNKCVEIMERDLPAVDFHIVVDTDDVNTALWNVEYISSCLDRTDWDCLSFSGLEDEYYDTWSVFYGSIKHHSWGFNTKGDQISVALKKLTEQKLAQLKGTNKFMKVLASFNGFAVYRTPVFYGLKYDGYYDNIKKFLTDQDRQEALEFWRNYLHIPDLQLNENFKQHVEHVYYQMSALFERNAKIRISPYSQFYYTNK